MIQALQHFDGHIQCRVPTTSMRNNGDSALTQASTTQALSHRSIACFCGHVT
jgi:hypothetical protein